jgi:hypothetical protein
MKKRRHRAEPEHLPSITRALRARFESEWRQSTPEEQAAMSAMICTLVRAAAALMNRPSEAPFILTDVEMQIDAFNGYIEGKS